MKTYIKEFLSGARDCILMTEPRVLGFALAFTAAIFGLVLVIVLFLNNLIFAVADWIVR